MIALRNLNLVLLAIVALGVFVRVAAFGSVPDGLNQDEASLGYDAYSILSFGVDRHLTPFPAFLIAWGSGMNVLAAYLAMPFIAVFGLTVPAIRMVNLLSGIGSIWALYFLVESIANKRLACWSAFVLSICPWHVMMCRWGLESNLLPAVFLFAVLALVKGIERPRLTPVSAALFGLCLYAYGTAYFAVPVFLVVAFAYLLWMRKINWPWVGLGAAVFLFVATPIVATIVINRFHLPSMRVFGLGTPRMTTVPRYEQISSLFGDGALDRHVKNLGTLGKLVAKQEDGATWNSIAEFGVVFPVGLGFALVGLMKVIRDAVRSDGFYPSFVMLVWLGAAVTLGMIQDSNINRINLLWIPLVYLVAVGLDHVATDKWRTVALVAVHLGLLACFCGTYFGSGRLASEGFFPQFGRAVGVATAAVKGDVCVTNRVNMPYALVLFFDRTNPHVFAKTVVYEGEGEFQGVRSFGRFTFGLDRCPPSTEAYILESGEEESIEKSGTRLFKSDRYTVVIKPKA